MSDTNNENLKDIEKKFYQVLTVYFSEKIIPTGLFRTIGSIEDQLKELNTNIDSSNKSSTKLTEALNRITLAGVIIAGLGVSIALANLICSLYQYKQNNIFVKSPNREKQEILKDFYQLYGK